MTYQIIQSNEVQNHKSTGFISIYKPIAGWKAIQYWWNPEMGGFWEPWQTGSFVHESSHAAWAEAQEWALAEDIPLIQYNSELTT